MGGGLIPYRIHNENCGFFVVVFILLSHNIQTPRLKC